MQEFLTPQFLTPMFIALILGIIVMIVRDRYYRKVKESKIDEIKKSKVQAFFLDDVEVTESRKSPLSAGYLWENADVVFTEKSIDYFGFAKILGFIPAYQRVRHFHLNGGNVLDKSSKSISVKTIKMKGADLAICYSMKMVEATLTIKNVADTEEIESIKKMLNITSADYQD